MWKETIGRPGKRPDKMSTTRFWNGSLPKIDSESEIEKVNHQLVYNYVNRVSEINTLYIEYLSKCKTLIKIHLYINKKHSSFQFTTHFHPPPRLLYKEIADCNSCTLSLIPFNWAANRLCSEVSTSV